jgi:sugar phosphate isomerase/epimerase
MGVALTSYALRWRAESPSATYPAFRDALDVLDHCVKLGAGGAQLGFGEWTADFAGRVRDRREALGLYLEGQIAVPGADEDLVPFEARLRLAYEAGATIVRTACLGGRRYETFRSPAEFEAFKQASWRSLERVEPILRRTRVQLAVENHKDWRADELAALMEHLGSEWMGVTLDFGNNLALVEDPMAVVEHLAPYAITTHVKDMAVEPYADGFLLSEVPLGVGVLNLPRIVDVCERHRPDIAWNLEMITRDPLKIPCLTDDYWSTFERVGGRDLARSLRLVASHPPKEPLPRIAHRNPADQLAFEEENNVRSFQYAREILGMG